MVTINWTICNEKQLQGPLLAQHLQTSIHPSVHPTTQPLWACFLTLKVLFRAGNNSILGASLVDWICRMWIPPCTADPTKGVHRVRANSARWKAPPSARTQGVTPFCRTVELTMPLTSVCEGRHFPARRAKRARHAKRAKYTSKRGLAGVFKDGQMDS